MKRIDQTSPPGLLQAIRGFRDGTLDRGQYLRDCAARADECESWLKAFTTRVPVQELVPALTGPLAGIPIGVKDIIATAGLRTTNGSRVYADHVPIRDAAIVTAIKRLGGTVFGKTATTEFAFRSPGPTTNPWNQAHTPGGSSSGSAAAVGAGIVPLALGTQTMGSVVRPAAYCGVVGFKASFGAVPRDGVYPLSGSLDHVGLMARTVDDVAYAYTLLGDPGYVFADGSDLAAVSFDVSKGLAPISAPRLAVVRTPSWENVDSEQRAMLDRAIQVLQAAGATVQDYSLPEIADQVVPALFPLFATEALDVHSDLAARYPDRVSHQIKELMARASTVAPQDYIAARRLQHRLRAEISARLAGFDAVLTVAASGEAPLGLEATGDASWCSPWTFLGFPALSVPAGWSARGLPLAVQIVGAYGCDMQTLRAAKFVESALDA